MLRSLDHTKLLTHARTHTQTRWDFTGCRGAYSCVQNQRITENTMHSRQINLLNSATCFGPAGLPSVRIINFSGNYENYEIYLSLVQLTCYTVQATFSRPTGE